MVEVIDSLFEALAGLPLWALAGAVAVVMAMEASLLTGVIVPPNGHRPTRRRPSYQRWRQMPCPAATTLEGPTADVTDPDVLRPILAVGFDPSGLVAAIRPMRSQSTSRSLLGSRR